MDNPILLFDGVCNLCNASVQTVIKFDREAKFRFASLQSEPGKLLLEKYNISERNLDSVILIYQGKYFSHSDAPLEICRLLGKFWQIFYIFKIIPPFIRNAIYRWIAKNRYRWFGKQESCWLPTPELKSRFL
jgi:predicted DCC family thiol-disulfide oxidoreductase YuxK